MYVCIYMCVYTYIYIYYRETLLQVNCTNMCCDVYGARPSAAGRGGPDDEEGTVEYMFVFRVLS